MKKSLFAFLVSFSAFASDCYVREVELVTNEVKLAKEICITEVANIENQFAVINYTLDGVATSINLRLENPVWRRSDGRVVYFLGGLETNPDVGWCLEFIRGEISASVTMNINGSNVKVEDIKGIVSTKDDECVSRDIQSFPYVLK